MNSIINYLQKKRGLNISGYNNNFIERRLEERLKERDLKNHKNYLELLEKDSKEINLFLDNLSINVSKFFRNNITFEFISKEILPVMIREKIKREDNSLRIWSAGCANGEETYSIAIIISELLKKEKISFNINIFGTDIDRTALDRAKRGLYPYEAIEEVKYGILKKYFTKKGDFFEITPEIKKDISFSYYDLVDSKSYSPPESIFGNFDIILCCNVLIYFSGEYQKVILCKLYRSLAKKSFLIFGEFEEPFLNLSGHLKRHNKSW